MPGIVLSSVNSPVTFCRRRAKAVGDLGISAFRGGAVISGLVLLEGLPAVRMSGLKRSNGHGKGSTQGQVIRIWIQRRLSAELT